MNLTIGNKSHDCTSPEFLAQSLASIEEQHCEIWLTDGNGPSLCCLKNGHRAILVFLRFEGDSGFVSRDSSAHGSDRIEFILSNGQKETYPKKWTIPYENACAVMERFWTTKAMDDRITWSKA